MALVEYSDSDESHTSTSKPEIENSRSLKRKYSNLAQKLPPLPSTFHDLYSSTVRVSNQDDPALHGGKERLTPHVEGQWPSHVYIEWCPSQTESSILTTIVKNLNDGCSKFHHDKVHSLVESELGAGLPLHISLSVSMMLLTEQRQNFLDTFQRQLYSSSVRPFKLRFTNLDWVVNAENTRTFLVLGLAKPEDNELNRLLQDSNQTASEFGFASLYAAAPPTQVRLTGRGRGYRGRTTRGRLGSHSKSREFQPSRPNAISDASTSFHVSIAWSLGSSADHLQKTLEAIRGSELSALSLMVNSIKVKIGNNVTTFPLSTKAKASEGILGS